MADPLHAHAGMPDTVAGQVLLNGPAQVRMLAYVCGRPDVCLLTEGFAGRAALADVVSADMFQSGFTTTFCTVLRHTATPVPL